MRFLVITEGKYPIPPEMGPRILEGMLSWADKYEPLGKIEAIWSYAGSRAGGGLLNVESLEELDEILTEAPLAAFSDIKVVPLADWRDSIQRGMRMMDEMARR